MLDGVIQFGLVQSLARGLVQQFHDDAADNKGHDGKDEFAAVGGDEA